MLFIKNNLKLKEKYIDFCQNTEGVSVFMQPWFLDVVCGADKWAVCMDFAKNGDINGVLVYHFVEKWGFKILKMPTLTPYMNLWLRNSTSWKMEYQLSFERTVIKSLISQLPRTVFSLQMYPPTFKNWLPFWWKDHRVEPMMNYVMDDLNDVQSVWANLKDTVRNKIRKAQKLGVTVEIRDDFNAFYQLFKETISRKNFNTGASENMLYQLHKEIQEREAGKIFFAVDSSGVIHGAIYVIWDCQKAFYWIATMNKAGGNSGATNLLLWTVLQELKQRGIQRLEVTGSMVENLESFISSFGAKQETYWKISRYSNPFFELLHFIKKLKR